MICKDIYSVKVWDSSVGNWCHEFMTKDRSLAVMKKREVENHSLGMIRRTKLVHPADWVVTAYLAFGNKLAT
jgi:hypothetical protein